MVKGKLGKKIKTSQNIMIMIGGDVPSTAPLDTGANVFIVSENHLEMNYVANK